jgi:integrase
MPWPCDRLNVGWGTDRPTTLTDPPRTSSIIPPLVLEKAPSYVRNKQGPRINPLVGDQSVPVNDQVERHLLNAVAREGKLANNPVLKLTVYKEPKGKTRFLSMEDERRLLEKQGSIHGPWARLAILTGLRQSEQFRLHWKEVDLERGMLTLLVTKAGGVQ